MPYKRQTTVAVDAAQKPQISPLTGGKLAKRSRVSAVMRAQDKVGALSRRIIGAQSLAGATSWSVPSTDPDGAPQTYPLTDEVRAVHRLRCDVTPGCFLRLWVMYIPSGATQIEVNPLFDYDPGPAGGRLQVDVTWTDQAGSTEDTVHEIPLVPSSQTYSGEPADPWASVRVAGIWVMSPTDVDDTATLARWTEHVHAEITISHVGGCRVVDAVVHEYPYALAREVDDDADLWTAHLFASEYPDGDAPKLTWPLQRASETTPDGDPRLGSWHLLDVANAQRQRLGPMLFSWTAWNETDADVTVTEIPVVQTTSTSLVRLFDGGAGYDPTQAGFSLCNYARAYAENHPYWSTNVASIPVLVCAYAATEDEGAAGTLRLQSSESSWIDVPITDREFGWWFGFGHLRCPVGVGDDVVCQPLIRMVSGMGAVRIKTICAYTLNGYSPTFA